MLWTEWSVARIPVGEEIFFPPKRLDRRRGPPSLFNGYWDDFTGGKRPWRDVHKSPPTRAAFKNVWGYTSNPHSCLEGVARDGFNFFNLKG
jgi:hypothetical protein